MHNTKKITKDLSWVGVNDRRLALFENVFPIPNGVSYNSYILKDEKTVLFDAVDKNSLTQFLENIKFELNGRELDYFIVNHMEPDHCATIMDVVKKYPNAKIVCNTKTKDMIKQFFNVDITDTALIIKEGDTLNTGNHTLTFLMAPMVHWPEVMVTYDMTDKILFSADAFGTFGTVNGNIFDDEVDFEKDWLDDARRYYTNIVGKYGVQVQNLLKKASALEIKMICPLHGLIWRSDLEKIIEKYDKWSKYEPEIKSVLIISGSIYGHTENVAEILAFKLGEREIKNIKMYDVSKTHPSYILSDAFKYSNIVIASSSYNAGIFCNMETLLNDLKTHNLQNKKVSIIQNGSWVPCACNYVEKVIDEMKNIEVIEPKITVKSALKEEQNTELDLLADNISNSIK